MPDLPRGKCLRNGRYSQSGQVYLITAVVQNRQSIFADWRLGRLVVEEFRYAQVTGVANSLAWVVMPDHIHWLFELNSSSLSALMQSTKSRSARAVNRLRNRHERLWQKGYYDRAIRKDDDLLKVARYIVANPLRAGLVVNVGDYPLWDAVWL